ncbi:transcriptional regulator, MerR family [Paenibacillus curdlanolyticus YK9]|uniref:Transcriptional regulator, MerR family n=1 Tax=Paenibacillus curdlanolyticus YK9 TaxID=717606 RepID=E0IFJ6_9BACL|nr:MerR family transcriptional regulator [Paenibacillus curdlanolyticus]EFM08972.1 transcriptional regulator, MerR family [Paenibacillus curdlanolyticus YK9]
MKIKEIAERLNLSARAIRFYEQRGLIAPLKQAGNRYRRFDEKDVWRLQTIIALREAGMAIEEIKQAFAEIAGDDYTALQHYLALQRAVLFAKWVEMKQLIETTDDMIQVLRNEKSLPIEQIYQLAEGSKRLRDQRSNWQDLWNFDQLASLHDQNVSANDQEYKDYELALDLTVKWVSPIAGEKGLDMGTGTGNLGGKLMAQGAQMAGVDQSKEMLNVCQSKFPAMDCKLGNFLAIPYFDGQFDFVVSSFAFRHLEVEQQQLAIDEMRRVLKPRGRLCLTDLMLADATDGQPPNRDKPYPKVADLISWLEARGYVTKTFRYNESLHTIYALPIR